MLLVDFIPFSPISYPTFHVCDAQIKNKFCSVWWQVQWLKLFPADRASQLDSVLAVRVQDWNCRMAGFVSVTGLYVVLLRTVPE